MYIKIISPYGIPCSPTLSSGAIEKKLRAYKLQTPPFSAIIITMTKNTSTPEKHPILQEIEGGYSVQSGVYGAVNKNVKTSLNEYGQYQADVSKLSKKELDELAKVSAMVNSDLNESVLGKKLFGKTKDIKHDKVLGYYTDLYAGYVATSDYRANASSGGIGTWLLEQLLEKKLIDGVIHVIPTDPKNDGILFKYTISKTPKAIKTGAKSRYYPGDLSEVLKTAKKSGGKYAITGIPSFITELRLLAEHDPEFKKLIAFTIGLVCGHQKSTKYAEALAWQHGIKPGDLISVDFRKKVEGQPSNRYISEFTGKINGKIKTITKDQDELFASNWAHGMFKSKLSDFTDDAFNELADISLGDAWLPEYTKDSKGNNVIIVRNKVIADIIKAGIKNKTLALDELTPQRVVKSQSGLVHHNQDELPYRLHKKDAALLWRPKKRVEASNSLPRLRKQVQDIREQIAVDSHTVYKKAVELNDWNYFKDTMKPLVRKYAATYRLVSLHKAAKKGPVFLSKKVVSKVAKKLKK